MSNYALLRFSDDPVGWGPPLTTALLQWDIDPALQCRMLALDADHWQPLHRGQLNHVPMRSITRARLMLQTIELAHCVFIDVHAINDWLHHPADQQPFNTRRPIDVWCSAEVGDLIAVYGFLLRAKLRATAICKSSRKKGDS